jgi:hypothetical protein
MTGDTIVSQGSIGASQPGVTQYVLNAEEIILECTRELEGYIRVTKEGGQGGFTYKKLTDNDYSVTHRPVVIAWMQSKLRGIMNKNTYLSYVANDVDVQALQWSIQHMFIDELLCRWQEFDLNEKKFLQLAEMHMNALYFATQQIIGGGVRGFLSKSTSETTSNVNQKISEEQAKKSLLGGILGGGGK